MVDRPALTPESVLRRLEWRVIRRLDGRLQGDYRTLFRGDGVDVVDLREYQPGDDLRHIDWNVTARTDTPHVRQYLEDRDVTAWLLLDRSPSMGFGPVDRQQARRARRDRRDGRAAPGPGRQPGRRGPLRHRRSTRSMPPGSGRKQVLRILSRLLHRRRPGADAAAWSGPGGARLRRGRSPSRCGPAGRRRWRCPCGRHRASPGGGRWS